VLSRVAALFGMALMAMFYCCQPPEPFAEAISGADGRFFVVERNFIEAVGLLLIVVLPCWRGFVRTLVPGVAALAAFGGCFWQQYKADAFKKVEAVTSATVKVHEFTALAALKQPISEKANVGGIEISRLALGGDLFAGRAHARDLIWTDDFMRRYNSGVTLGRTIRYCLHCGIDTVFADCQFLAPMLAEARAVKGELKFFAGCMDGKEAAAAASGGAKAVYLRNEATDAAAKKGDAAKLKELFAALKAAGLPAGVAAEDLETVKFCVANGVVPDFWIIAFHSLEYPAARMEQRCNNIWCTDPDVVSAYMKTRNEPWVAMRCLAGGALDPVAAYKFAKDGGATAASIDLLDYRIVETVNGIMAPPKKAPAAKAPAAKAPEAKAPAAKAPEAKADADKGKEKVK